MTREQKGGQPRKEKLVAQNLLLQKARRSKCPFLYSQGKQPRSDGLSNHLVSHKILPEVKGPAPSLIHGHKLSGVGF